METFTSLRPDMFSVAYNPGQSVKINPVFASFYIQNTIKIPAIFTLSTQDMSKRSLEGLLLGAQILGLNNVVFVMGDTLFANSLTTTKTIELTKNMNQGFDFNNNKLEYPTEFCIGATLDISKNWDKESLLTQKKIRAGADFLLAQAQFDIPKVEQFLEHYHKLIGTHINLPILWGVQMLMNGSKSFTNIPSAIKQDLLNGRSSVDVTLNIIKQYNSYGIHSFYLLPPFFKNGQRDYALAQKVISLLTSY